MALLTREEGIQFVQTILNIPLSDVPTFPDETLPLDAKLAFLETLLRSFQEKEPFQSIYLMSHDIYNRRRPTWEEVKRDMMLGRGGLCYWQNVFMYALLCSLGLDACMTFSTVDVGTGSTNNHVIVLIRDLAPGSLHLVDVGVGLYIPRAVPLDFQLESAEYHDSFATYKVVREPDGIMYFMKKDAKVVPKQELSTSDDDQTRPQETHVLNNTQQELYTSNDDQTRPHETHVLNNTQQELYTSNDDQMRPHETHVLNNTQQELLTSNDDQTRPHETHVLNNTQQETKTEKYQREIFETTGADATACGPRKLHPKSVVATNQDSGQQSTWHKFYFFDPSVVLTDLEPLYPDFDVHFSDPTRLSTHSSPRAMCWRNGRFIALVNLKLLEEVEVGKLKKTTIVESLETKLSFKNIPKKSNQPANSAKDEPHLQPDDHLMAKADIGEKVEQEQDNDHEQDKVQEQNNIQEQDKVQEQNNIQKQVSILEQDNDHEQDNVREQTNVQPALADLDPLIQAYEKYFPQLPREMVESAMENWLATGTLFPVPQHFV